MCGKQASLMEAEVDGAELKVCPNCARYGHVKSGRNLQHQRFGTNRKAPMPTAPKPEFAIVSTFSSLIKSCREQRKLSQEEFATFIQEKESILQKWESGQLKPSLDVAKRLEKVLSVVFVVKEDLDDFDKSNARKTDSLTLGDFIKIKKRN